MHPMLDARSCATQSAAVEQQLLLRQPSSCSATQTAVPCVLHLSRRHFLPQQVHSGPHLQPPLSPHLHPSLHGDVNMRI